jgi:hypothetical protein
MRYIWYLMAPGLADRIIVWSYSDNGAYTFESCYWYSPDSFGPIQASASHFIEDQLYGLYASFSEYLNLAEFPDVEEQLEPSEMEIFLKAVNAPDDTVFCSIDYDCFPGLCAVIRHRLEQRSMEHIKLAAELFNGTMAFGLFFCDNNPNAVIRIGSAEDVAPILLERILNRLRDDATQRTETYEASPSSSVELRFLPLAPVLMMLKETVQLPDWVQNQLALRIFFWIVEMYKAEVEN